MSCLKAMSLLLQFLRRLKCLHSADARWLSFAAAVCIIGKFLREATKCVKQKMRRRNQIAKTNNRRNCGFHCHIIGLITGISVRLRLCFSVDGKCDFILFAGLFPPLISVVSSLCFMICLPFASPYPPPLKRLQFSLARHLRASTFLRRRICQAVTVEGKLGQSWSRYNSAAVFLHFFFYLLECK